MAVRRRYRVLVWDAVHHEERWRSSVARSGLAGAVDRAWALCEVAMAERADADLDVVVVVVGP